MKNINYELIFLFSVAILLFFALGICLNIQQQVERKKQDDLLKKYENILVQKYNLKDNKEVEKLK